MLKTKSISYAYNQENSFIFPDITLAKNEHLLVLGQSGIGKTTFMYLMAGLVPPSSGTVSLDNIDLSSLSSYQKDIFIGKNIGLIFQQYQFIHSLSVHENLKLRMSFPELIKDKSRINNIAQRLGLSNQLNKKVTELSQGQQQRLAIALGIIHKPKIIFADEPTSNLDDHNCEKVIALLKEEAKLCESCLVIITHDSRVKSHFKNQIEL